MGVATEKETADDVGIIEGDWKSYQWKASTKTLKDANANKIFCCSKLFLRWLILIICSTKQNPLKRSTQKCGQKWVSSDLSPISLKVDAAFFQVDVY